MKIEHKDFAFQVKEIGENGVFSGYGSVFGELDYGGDIVAKGAFTRTLAETKAKGRKIPVLWQHRSAEAIGVYDDIREDEKGLFVQGRLLINEVQQAKEAFALLKEGAVTGLSIGYGVQKSNLDEQTYIRTLLDLDLYEVSQVTFPMLDSARIDAVKNRIREGVLPSLKQFEDFLCEAGFSKTQSRAIANNGLSKLIRCEAVQENSAHHLELLKGFDLPSIFS